MAKKKTKSSAPKSSRKSHGVLFDKHPNLIWLLPVFLIIAAVAVVMYNNSMTMKVDSSMLQADQVPQVDVDSSGY
jgi:hypothetical protein